MTAKNFVSELQFYLRPGVAVEKVFDDCISLSVDGKSIQIHACVSPEDKETFLSINNVAGLDIPLNDDNSYEEDKVHHFRKWLPVLSMLFFLALLYPLFSAVAPLSPFASFLLIFLGCATFSKFNAYFVGSFDHFFPRKEKKKNETGSDTTNTPNAS
jgi:hypothetical protein